MSLVERLELIPGPVAVLCVDASKELALEVAGSTGGCSRAAAWNGGLASRCGTD